MIAICFLNTGIYNKVLNQNDKEKNNVIVWKNFILKIMVKKYV
jgi:hypothetical protein